MSIIDILRVEFAAILAKIGGEAKRATPYSAIYQTVQMKLEALMPEQYPSLVDLYDDAGATYVICAAGGKVYRAPIIPLPDGDVIVGKLEEVPLFERAAGKLSIVRQADGVVRWFAIAATSVLNRVSEIDSRALFDSFVSHAEKTKEYPVLRFFHTPGLDFGTADYLAREGYAYLASGLLDMQHPLAQAFVDAIETGRGTWGCSIGFLADEAVLTEVTQGIRIPVYHSGINREISVLPEAEAASWYTAITEVSRMNERVRKALLDLVGSEEKVAAFLATVDETNTTIEERGLITRAEPTATPPTGHLTTDNPLGPGAALFPGLDEAITTMRGTAAPVMAEGKVIYIPGVSLEEWNEMTVEQRQVAVDRHATTDVEKAAKETAAQKAAERDELTAHIIEAAGIGKLAERMDAIEKALADLKGADEKRSIERADTQRNIDTRLAALEVILKEWQETRSADMPAAGRLTGATYRPRTQAQAGAASMAATAEATLAKLPNG